LAQKGEIPVTKCPECDVELEITQTHPVHLIVLSEEDDDEEDEESSVKKVDEEEEEEAE